MQLQSENYTIQSFSIQTNITEKVNGEFSYRMNNLLTTTQSSLTSYSSYSTKNNQTSSSSKSYPWWLWFIVAICGVIMMLGCIYYRRKRKREALQKAQQALQEEFRLQREHQDQVNQLIREQQQERNNDQNQNNKEIRVQLYQNNPTTNLVQNIGNQNMNLAPPLLSYYVRPPIQSQLQTKEQFIQQEQDELRSDQRLQMLLRSRMQQHQIQNIRPQAKNNENLILRIDGFEVWQNLNTQKVTENNISTDNKVCPVSETCSICLESLEVRASVVVPCQYQHSFHKDCIKSWLEFHDTCPHCRGSLKYRDIR